MSLIEGLDRADFIARFGGIFEHSPWIAAGAFDAGLGPAAATAAGLHAALCAVLDRAERAAKLALLNAHPDLAGKLALARQLTADSTAEQAGAGLDRLTPDELARFTALNDAYKARFGHPFIIAVKGLDKHAILAAFEQRIGHSPEVEFETALAQVKRIALLRLQALG
ncbi:2-oxo-4-hydroxy-4-carboxy-5-ureidoimidazoline decarboxylase [Zavarzinia compransoris]|uniref:2-oxo-4-hydroxy-4-carboxy-5-ureidoimidazoline decarboxylase n=1 Tax=Zavarzinia compransoris TaxID=1264899 RepID=A0A317E8H0_9PROT|nr:2-oxo-4-hydroxy-4-carboxy-5-ureidoimidazoline decarboxylase [Zavarzinia compransoris]PWR23458.1 2-oxo-4-hydroxy-4-carboxy-5-ureidoimidazoline decarboxylase [Zavarzinia compransoris]TDP45962.1 OHCU decarboxylase [Zavarzinia compransoris]